LDSFGDYHHDLRRGLQGEFGEDAGCSGYFPDREKISIFAKEGLLAGVEGESMVNGQEYFDDSQLNW